MTERSLRDALRRAGGDDAAARERAWRVVRAAYAEHVPSRRRPSWWLGALAAAALAAGGVGAAAASAPDSGVGGWVRDVLGVGDGKPMPALGALPGGGRVLAQADGSAWLVSSDGTRRRLGSYAGAAWSPRGRFVIAWRRGTLAALALDGGVRWSLSRPAPVSAARWGPVDGFRVAYVTGAELRIVNGDGTGDRAFAATLAGVAPAWQPDASRLLAYADRRGRIELVNVDTGGRRWRTAPLGNPRSLAWSPGGRRLLVATPRALLLLDARGRRVASRSVPSGVVVEHPAFAPDGRRVAVVRRDVPGGRSEVELLDVARGLRSTALFAGPGRFGTPAWSPGGDRLLVPWPAADQWLFLRPRDGGRVTAVAEIAAQFSPGAGGPRFADAVAWCCSGR